MKKLLAMLSVFALIVSMFAVSMISVNAGVIISKDLNVSVCGEENEIADDIYAPGYFKIVNKNVVFTAAEEIPASLDNYIFTDAESKIIVHNFTFPAGFDYSWSAGLSAYWMNEQTSGEVDIIIEGTNSFGEDFDFADLTDDGSGVKEKGQYMKGLQGGLNLNYAKYSFKGSGTLNIYDLYCGITAMGASITFEKEFTGNLNIKDATWYHPLCCFVMYGADLTIHGGNFDLQSALGHSFTDFYQYILDDENPKHPYTDIEKNEYKANLRKFTIDGGYIKMSTNGTALLTVGDGMWDVGSNMVVKAGGKTYKPSEIDAAGINNYKSAIICVATPETGDTTNVMLWVVIGLSAAILTFAFSKKFIR